MNDDDTCDPQWLDTRLAALSVREIRAMKAAAFAEGAMAGWLGCGQDLKDVHNPYLEEIEDERV